MNERDEGDRIVEVVTWALDRILNNEYYEERDAQGNLLYLQFRTKPLDTEFLEGLFKEILPPEQSEAILSLKECRSREDIDRVLRLVFPSEIAARGVEELEGADWPEIVAYVGEQVKFLRFHIGQKIAEVLVKEREGFSTPFGRDAERFLEERVPEGLAAMPATKYARDFREVFPEMVKRATAPGFRLLSASREVPVSLQRYLIEASRCYIYGHFLASLIVCRSAIEEAVKQRLKDIGKQEEIKKDDSLFKLLPVAKQEGLLDKTRYDQADNIRKKAKNAVHGKGIPPDEECVDALQKTRGILEHLYGRLQ